VLSPGLAALRSSVIGLSSISFSRVEKMENKKNFMALLLPGTLSELECRARATYKSLHDHLVLSMFVIFYFSWQFF
jgi:hypothetical protein